MLITRGQFQHHNLLRCEPRLHELFMQPSLTIMKNKLNLIKRIVYLVTYAFIIALVILMSSTAGVLPAKTKIYTVMSGSMEPSIKTGSIVATRPQSNYSVGDVITFYSDRMEQITTHRISEVINSDERTFYKTKGDANDSEDSGMIVSDNILGKKIITLPYLGYLISFVRSKFGFILFMLVPALLIVIDELRKITLEIKQIRSRSNNYSSLTKLGVVILWFLLIPLSSGQNSSHAFFKSQTELSSNIVVEKQILDFYYNGDKTAVGFKITGIKDFQILGYQVFYEHDGIKELDNATINLSGQNEFKEEWIILGTCSDGVCTYHQNITELSLMVKLFSPDTGVVTFEKTL